MVSEELMTEILSQEHVKKLKLLRKLPQRGISGRFGAGSNDIADVKNAITAFLSAKQEVLSILP
ncbi:MAG: hypothetical protein ACLSA2_01725 [Candidatus Gastranaerophilaceae bacterium]